MKSLKMLNPDLNGEWKKMEEIENFIYGYIEEIIDKIFSLEVKNGGIYKKLNKKEIAFMLESLDNLKDPIKNNNDNLRLSNRFNYIRIFSKLKSQATYIKSNLSKLCTIFANNTVHSKYPFIYDGCILDYILNVIKMAAKYKDQDIYLSEIARPNFKLPNFEDTKYLSRKYTMILNDYKILENGRKVYRIELSERMAEGVKESSIGGYIEKYENLSQFGKCSLFGNAIISQNARVIENAKIGDYAYIHGNAVISGNAIIGSYTEIDDNTIVSGNPFIFSYAKINGNSSVSGNVCISDNAKIENSNITGEDKDSDNYSCDIKGKTNIINSTVEGINNNPSIINGSDGEIIINECNINMADIKVNKKSYFVGKNITNTKIR